jgi:hypothetical protein
MSNLAAQLAVMPADHRDVALMVLDTMSRPLRSREIEGALRLHGCSKSQATKLANALRPLAIIAVVGPEDTGGGSKLKKSIARTPPPSRNFHAHSPGSFRARDGASR